MTSRVLYGITMVAGVIALLGLAACQLASPRAVVKTSDVVSAGATSGDRVGIVDRAAPVSASSVVLWGEVPKQCT